MKLLKSNKLVILLFGVALLNISYANDNVCSMINNNYIKAVTQYGIPLETIPPETFLDKATLDKRKHTYVSFVSFNNPKWLKDAKWMQWKFLSVSGEKYSVDRNFKLLAVSEKLPDNTRFLLSIGFMFAGWGESYFYEIYSVDGDTPTNSLTDLEALLSAESTRKVFPNDYYRANTFGAYHLKNIFEYNGSYYLFGGDDWEVNKFNVVNVEHGNIKKICEFSNYRTNNKPYEFLRLFNNMINKITGCGYDNTCKGNGGDWNCWHSEYLTNILKHKQNSQMNFDKSEDFVHYNDLASYKVFRLFSNSDIWSKRFANSFFTFLPLAKKDLIALLIDDGFSEQKASETSEIIISDALRRALNGSRLYFLEHENKNIDEYDVETLKKAVDYLHASDIAYSKGVLPRTVNSKYDADLYSLALSHIPKIDDAQLKSFVKANEFGKNLLMYAVQMNDFEATKRLIKFYQKSASIEDDDDCTNITLQGRTVMHYAAENASLGLIALLIQQGFPITDKDDKGNDLSFYLQKNMLISDENKKLGMKFFEQLQNEKKEMVVSPSFDCKKASNAKERAICENQTLANYDASLGFLYSRLKTNLRFNDIKQSQREWLKSLNRICKTSAFSDSSMICLINQYRDRNYFLYKFNEYIENASK